MYTDPDPDRVEAWAEQFPGANWAILCGTELDGGHVVVLDLDSAKAVEVYQRLDGRIKAPTCTTKRGLHLIFLWPSSLPLPPKARITLPGDVIPDAELITRGYALIPPSTVNGKRYRWVVKPVPGWLRDDEDGVFPPPRLPDWLLELALQALGEKREPPKAPSHRDPSPWPNTVLDLLDTMEELTSWIALRLGTAFRGHGKPVRCPFHPPDRHASTAWYRLPRGQWALYDFHDGKLWLLPDLAGYLRTGELRRLAGFERVKALQWAAHKAGILQQLTERVADANERVLAELFGVPAYVQTHDLNIGVGGWGKSKTGILVVKTWQALKERFVRNAEQGLPSAIAPTHGLAAALGLPVEVVCRAINLLAVLGFVAKVVGGEAYEDPRERRKRHNAQILALALADPEEARRRWEALGRPTLRRFNKALVARILGENLANAVFRADPPPDKPQKQVERGKRKPVPTVLPKGFA